MAPCHAVSNVYRPMVLLSPPPPLQWIHNRCLRKHDWDVCSKASVGPARAERMMEGVQMEIQPQNGTGNTDASGKGQKSQGAGIQTQTPEKAREGTGVTRHH